HHEAGVVNAEEPHHPSDVARRRGVVEVLEVLRVDTTTRKQVARPPALRATGVEPDADLLAHRSTVLVPRTLHRPTTWELRASAALRCSLTGPPSSFLGRCTALPHGSCAPPLRFGARSPVHRPRSSDAAPLCHMGAARLRWLRCSLTGPPSSFLGRCTALPHGSCAPPLASVLA